MMMRQVDKLIVAVRDRPLLYDQSSQTSKQVSMKNRNWMEVARIMYGREDKVTVNKVKIQWKSLRDAFVKHQRKRKNFPNMRIRSYIYEEEMQFLLPHIVTRQRAFGGETSIGEGDDDIPLSKLEVKSEVVEDQLEDSSLNASYSGESQQETPQEFVWHNMDEHPAENKGAHPVDAFFHGMAQTVKLLRPATIARIKKAVADVVLNAEIEELEGENAAPRA